MYTHPYFASIKLWDGPDIVMPVCSSDWEKTLNRTSIPHRLLLQRLSISHSPWRESPPLLVHSVPLGFSSSTVCGERISATDDSAGCSPEEEPLLSDPLKGYMLQQRGEKVGQTQIRNLEVTSCEVWGLHFLSNSHCFYGNAMSTKVSASKLWFTFSLWVKKYLMSTYNWQSY